MISALPKNVINNIMPFLPFIDATRMSVLSKKWRSSWLSITQLILDDEFTESLQTRNMILLLSSWQASSVTYSYFMWGP